jgi:hypothetical protein
MCWLKKSQFNFLQPFDFTASSLQSSPSFCFHRSFSEFSLKLLPYELQDAHMKFNFFFYYKSLILQFFSEIPTITNPIQTNIICERKKNQRFLGCHFLKINKKKPQFFILFLLDFHINFFGFQLF